MASKALDAIEEVTRQARHLATACAIRAGLHNLYSDVVNEPVPARFTDLLNLLPGGKGDGRTVSEVDAAGVDIPCGCGCGSRHRFRRGDMAQGEES